MTDKNPDERKSEADAKRAEAEARTAEAAALKAQRENEEWESDLAKQAREAEQRRLIAEAEGKAREAEQTLRGELALQKLEAEAKKAIAEADKSTADAQRAQVSAFIPDFSKIEKGETTLKGDKPILGSLLTPLALDDAAKKVVDDLRVASTDRVLITTEADLAATDAVYVEVVTGLTTLTEAARDLLEAIDTATRRDRRRGAGAVVGAIASAAPGLISLFSANRALSSFAADADTAAAVAAVASKLSGKATVQIDNFCTVQGGDVAAKEKSLRDARSELAARKLEVESAKAQADDEEVPVAAAVIGELITQIDAFLTSLHTSGGKPSPFTTAALRQQLHSGGQNGGPAFDKLLFIKASASAADQLLHDRPLWLKDKIQLIGSVAIVYWLMDTATSNIVASGVARGAVQINGKIGDKLEVGRPSSLELAATA